MSDQAVVVFSQDGEDIAAVFVYWDGSMIDAILAKFFENEDANPDHDNRFGDARFVVATSDHLGTGVGIVPVGDRAESNWRVFCDSDQWPPVERIEG